MRKGMLIALLALYWLWSRTGRKVNEPPSGLHLEDLSEYGRDCGKGNLLGVQPFMVPVDYASEDRFYTKLASYLEEAAGRGWLNERTILVFPEHIGTWLVAADEKRTVYRAPTITRALAIAVFTHPLGTIRWLLFAQAEDRLRYSLFRMKADQMALLYHRTFSRLARRYGVTVVAGSIVLPDPKIQRNRLEIQDGPLYNVSIVYRSDGSPHDEIVRKIFPTPEELPFVARPESEMWPVFDTPAGRLGVLICADSWYPQAYEAMQDHGVEMIAVPSYLMASWERPWPGYGYAVPSDVDPSDVWRIAEGEATLKYTLPGRIHSSGARYGINVFLRGRIWDLPADGHTILIDRGRAIEARHVCGAALINLWLS